MLYRGNVLGTVVKLPPPLEAGDAHQAARVQFKPDADTRGLGPSTLAFCIATPDGKTLIFHNAASGPPKGKQTLADDRAKR